MNWLSQPWPWYVAGPLIGLTVPLLLWLGNKRLGISSSLRHICAACFPGHLEFFRYDWKKEIWSFYFIGGLFIGGLIAGIILADPNPVAINDKTSAMLSSWGVSSSEGLLPSSVFNWNTLITLKGLIIIAIGGFMVGFGTRYAGGCTSGHGIFGLSTLQLPSLLATASFFLGGIIFSYLVLPYVLAL